MYEYPPILQGNEKKQIADMRDYLIRLIRTMEEEKSEAERVSVMNKSRQTQQTAQQQTTARPGLKLKDVVDKIYPIGSIYISASATNPQELFGGEWTQIKARFLLAAGDTYAAGSTGGEATHTLTIDEMPSHTHGINFPTQNGDTWGVYGGGGQGGWGLEVAGTNNNYGRQSNQYTGGSQPHNNMPPYLAVYVWQRTA